MLGTRYENYENSTALPFVLRTNILRTPHNLSRAQNWHEELELQLCTDGEGQLLLGGEKFPFRENDIAVVNSNVLHYTATDNNLTYSCLIIRAAFCRQMGIDCDRLSFRPLIQSPVLTDLFLQLTAVCADKDAPLPTAQAHHALLALLIELVNNHTDSVRNNTPKCRTFDAVKQAITYLHRNYHRRITLNELAEHVMMDKYALCREFKKATGQTIFGYLGNYRCLRSCELLKSGCSVSEAASSCGFENLSYFTKTFKKHIGQNPSIFRKDVRISQGHP
jgi:AraC-like DNA-binding protein